MTEPPSPLGTSRLVAGQAQNIFLMERCPSPVMKVMLAGEVEPRSRIFALLRRDGANNSLKPVSDDLSSGQDDVPVSDCRLSRIIYERYWGQGTIVGGWRSGNVSC